MKTEKKKKPKKKSSALALRDPLTGYLQEMNAYPFLTETEELDLAKRYHEQGDIEAARKLVTSHLRLVAKIAMEYRSAYHNVLDLIQEGTVGLLTAVQKYDPKKGARLGHYAQWWIRSFILKFILDNFRLMKIGTTKNQRKLFFNLMNEKQKIEAMGYYASPALLSKQLGVPEKEVVEMQKRLTQPEYALDAPINNRDGGNETLLSDFIALDEKPLDEAIADAESQDILKEKFAEFAKSLNERDLKIFEERLMSELPLTLQAIADDYGITKERVRQIESRLIDRLKKFFKESGVELDMIQEK